MPPRPQSLLDQLETSFRLLTTGPNPLALDGRQVGYGLPARPIPYGELRSMLLHPSVSYAARDTTLRLLVRRARAERGAAMIGLVGILLPGLRCAATPVLRAYPAHAADLEAEILAGLVAEIGSVSLEEPRVAARLLRNATRAGYRLLDRLYARRQAEWLTPLSALPSAPANHPDLVLAEAVKAGVLSARDAELLGENRVGQVPLRVLAARWGVGYEALRKRRQRAEPALAAWLVSRQMSPIGG